jgi:hypothetical protein
MDFEETQTEADQAWLQRYQRVEVEDPSGRLNASGLCPRCGDGTYYPIILEDVAVAEAAGPVVSLDVTRMFRCRCSEVHPKRPKKVYTGCGAYWFARVTHDGTTYSLSEAPPEFVAGAVAVDQAVRDQGALVRSTAEKWLGAVTALLALFSVGGSVLAVDALDGLATWAQVVAGVAGVLALACGAAAVYCGHRAAFGWLHLAPTNTNAAAAELLVRAQDVGGRVRDFRNAVFFAFAALGLAVLALAVIWFDPASEAPRPLVGVTYRDAGAQTTLCGRLLDATQAGSLRIEVTEGSRISVTTIPLTRVSSIGVVASCPS